MMKLVTLNVSKSLEGQSLIVQGLKLCGYGVHEIARGDNTHLVEVFHTYSDERRQVKDRREGEK